MTSQRIDAQRDYWLLDDHYAEAVFIRSRQMEELGEKLEALHLDRNTLFLAPTPPPEPNHGEEPVRIRPEEVEGPPQGEPSGLFIKSEFDSDTDSQGWVIA